MSIVKLEGADETAQPVQQPTASAPAKSDESTSRAGAAAMELFHRGSTEPAAYVAFLRLHPELQPMLTRLLHQRFGNGFVMTVLDALERQRVDTDAMESPSARTDSANTKELHRRYDRKDQSGVGGTLNHGLDHFDPAQLPEGTRPVSSLEHRANLIAGIKGMRDGLFDAMKDGAGRAEQAAAERDMPPHVESSVLLSILGEAVSAVLAGTNATAALWLAGKIIRSAAKPSIEFAKNALKEVMKDSLHSAFSGKSATSRDLFPSLKQSFFTAVTGEFNNRKQLLEQEWSGYGDRLASLSDEQLEQAHQHAAGATAAAELQARMMDSVLVSWTNFLAMVDNGHKGWDFWEKNGGRGAVPTRDASEAPIRKEDDPSSGNIDPARTGNFVASHGDPGRLPGMQHYARHLEPSTGVLEVFCDWNGQISHDYGMTIANVGPAVRDRLVTFGRVGNLPVNKNIHVLMDDPDEIVENQRISASILVTADGYIREVTWDAPGGPRRAANVAKVVERVQNLPLSLVRK